MADGLTGDAASLDDVRETGAVRARPLPGGGVTWIPPGVDAAADLDRAESLALSRRHDALRIAARDLIAEVDAHIRPVVGRVTAEDLATVRAALERLRALL